MSNNPTMFDDKTIELLGRRGRWGLQRAQHCARGGLAEKAGDSIQPEMASVVSWGPLQNRKI
jgi:hypothetical protein